MTAAMDHYDFIIAGGGLSGLSLAYHLAHSPLREHSILIVDPIAGVRSDRTWSFWTRHETPFDAAISHTWDRLLVHGGGVEQVVDLAPYHYHTIRGEDFYRHARQQLAGSAQFRQGRVEEIEDGQQGARVRVDGDWIKASWVMDARGSLPPRHAVAGPFHDQILRFEGWEVETAEAAFDPDFATFLDFRTPQQEHVRFFYVLPYSRHRALVEYTLFTTTRIGRQACHQAIDRYLREVLQVQDYRIVAREGGAIPVSDRPHLRQLGPHTLAIGARGGSVKPTTGYAFTRIQQDSASIVQSLVQQGHPFQVDHTSPTYHLMDCLMLDVMSSHPEQVEILFTKLFQGNPGHRVLRFLDEEASPAEIIALIASLPPVPFLEALVHAGTTLFRRPWRWPGHPLPAGQGSGHSPSAASGR